MFYCRQLAAMCIALEAINGLDFDLKCIATRSQDVVLRQLAPLVSFREHEASMKCCWKCVKEERSGD
jgi:hypothetical protein